MLPISIVFNKFPRLVRDLAQKQKKNINFTVQGEATELDRNIIEQIRDPLIHLLRNAIDHGIESQQERKAKGKPSTAEIVLTAQQEEGHILITLKDDGKGINPEKVKSSAIKKGIILSESADNISDEEIIDLIFSPGISTAEKVTEISGRGVGLDIVRSNIEKLNGSISVTTQVNTGTTFIIKLPLTIAVFRGLMVTIAESVFIIPMTSVIETKKIQSDDIATILGERVMRLRENVIPIMHIEDILNKEIALDDNYDNKYVVVVKSGERLAGIIVEQLLEQQEFVIKPLGNFLGELKGIAGASILGNGRTALILDIPTLMRMLKYQSNENKNKIALLI
jgi:two-component system chemotaxis sensor kinase CheA